MMNLIEKARFLRPIIERAVVNLNQTDEEALSCAELYPAWDDSAAYEVGNIVRVDGQLYRCVQAHTAQTDWTPAASASLWSAISIDPATGYDEWTQPTGAHDAYNKGARVVYNGTVYESLIDGNTYAPDAYPAGWVVVE